MFTHDTLTCKQKGLASGPKNSTLVTLETFMSCLLENGSRSQHRQRHPAGPKATSSARTLGLRPSVQLQGTLARRPERRQKQRDEKYPLNKDKLKNQHLDCNYPKYRSTVRIQSTTAEVHTCTQPPPTKPVS